MTPQPHAKQGESCILKTQSLVHSSTESDGNASASLIQAIIESVHSLPKAQAVNGSIIPLLEPLISHILALWNKVAFELELQIGLMEDQLEEDFWDKAQHPVSILHKTQRLSRWIIAYLGQLQGMKRAMTPSRYDDRVIQTPPPLLMMDIFFIEERLNGLLKRAEKAVQALLASIAINEGVKASSLTAVALWFAPLSLAVSIVSIDGRSQFGGRKYWIMIAIGVPLLALVIAVANVSDKILAALHRTHWGRLIMSLFNPKTRVGRPR